MISNSTLCETNMKPPKIGLFITPKGHASPPTFDLIRGESYMLVSGRCFFIHGRSRKNDDPVQAHDGELPSIVPGPQVG